MKEIQKQTSNSSLSLRLKIIIGYVALLALLNIIVFLMWLEHRKMEALNNGELLMSEKEKL